MGAGLLVGLLSGLLSRRSWSLARLPPFIATLGVMGIARGAAFIITEGRYFDVSSKLAAAGDRSGLPADWVAPIVMIVLAVVFQILMTRFQWGRAVFAVGGNETAALFSGIRVGRVKTSVYVIARPARGGVGRRARGRPGTGQGRSRDRLRAGHHRVGRRRRREPLRRPRLGGRAPCSAR